MSQIIAIQEIEPILDGVSPEDHLVSYRCTVQTLNGEISFVGRFQNSRLGSEKVIPLHNFPEDLRLHELEQACPDLAKIIEILFGWFEGKSISLPLDIKAVES